MRTCSFSPRAVPIVLTSVLLTACVFSATAARSKQPILRFGDSEFRLTAKGGNGPTFRFSADGKLIAGANWEEVKLWSFPDGKLLHDFSSVIQCDCIGFAADGKELLALERRRMEIYRFDVAGGKLLATVKLEDVEEERGATTYRLSSDGRWLYMTEVYSHLAIWDATTGKRQFRKETGLSKGARGGISDAGVLTLWDNLFIDRYDVRTGEQLSRKKIYERMGVLASNPQGTLLAAYSPNDKSIIFWDTVEDKQVGGKIPVADEHKRELRDTALSADGRRFVFWLFRDKWLWNRRVAIFDVETGKMISSFDPPGAYSLDQPEISPDGRYMFLAGGRSVFTPVDTTTGELVHEIPDHILAVHELDFTPNGRTLLIGSDDKTQAWSVDSGKPGPSFEKWRNTPHIAAVDNNAAFVSGLKGGGVRLHNIKTGAVEHEYETGNDKHFAEIQLSLDRKSFVAMQSLQGGDLRRWRVLDGKILSERQMPAANFQRGIDLSKMSRGLTLGGSRLIRLDQVVPAKKRPDGSIDWGQMELVLEDWTAELVTNRLPVPALGRFAFADNGNGTLLAAVTSDARNPPSYGEKWGSTHLQVWDIATGWERLRIDREMHNYSGAFVMVAMTRDGRLVATVTGRNRVEIWNGFNGYELDGFDADRGVSAIAFSNDGTMLATGHQDGSVFLWDTRLTWDQAVLPRRFNQKMAQKYWEDLGGDGRKPALAWQTLLGNPEQALEMLKTNLKQVTSTKGIAGVLESVIVPMPEDQEVLDASPPVLPMMRALHQALEKATSEETRNHYKQLLDAASRPMTPDMRRPILAILLTEQIDTAESRELIEEIAAGAAGAFETQVAKSALVRIRLRKDTRDKPARE